MASQSTDNMNAGYPRGTVMQPAGEMKPHYQRTMKERREELMTLHNQRPNDDLSIAELRTMLKEFRRQKGMVKAKTRDNMDTISRAKTAGAKELRKICEEIGVSIGEKATVGEMRLAIRMKDMDSVDEKTVLNFCRHKGKTYRQVHEVDSQYLTWAIAEVKRSHSPDHNLVKFARWAEKLLKGETDMSDSDDKEWSPVDIPTGTSAKLVNKAIVTSADKCPGTTASSAAAGSLSPEPAMTATEERLLNENQALKAQLDELTKMVKEHAVSIKEKDESRLGLSVV